MGTEPTGIERTIGDEEIIVSKTDRHGRITYANEVFQRVAGYRERELIGQPHSIVRHPEMPRCVFSVLWTTIEAGKEIFAYVLNMAKGGDHYWVFAHVTPTFGPHGDIIGYHSSRRSPDREAIRKIVPIYAQLLAEERKHAGKAEQIAASSTILTSMLSDAGVGYDEFVFSL
jgi:PAS domain S-box-containing protein